jgi:nucleoside-diphosphate-sugar epimerase
MRIAVTGATGFLGRYLVRRFAAAGHALRCWYRAGSDRSGLEDCAQTIAWLPGELGNAATVQALVRGMDAVVHAGLARSSGTGFTASAQSDILAFAERNVLGSLQLFQAAYEAGVPRARAVGEGSAVPRRGPKIVAKTGASRYNHDRPRDDLVPC